MKTFNTIDFDYGKKTVAFDSISYFKSEFGNYTKVIMTKEKDFLSSFTLKYYCKKLNDSETFVMPRKGIMVNVKHVEKLDESRDGLFVVMKNGEKFKVSRRRTEEMMEKFQH